MFYASASVAGEWIDELRLGVYEHDSELADNNKEEGVAVSLQVLFPKVALVDDPGFIGWLLSPRPQIGGNVNISGDTNFAYAGFAWEWMFLESLFVEGVLSMAGHDGELSTADPDRRSLGCRWAFHQQATLGIEIAGHHRLMTTIEHMSNAGVCDPNDGLTNLGIRYGYKF